MNKMTYCKKFMLWTGIITMVIIAIIGLVFGSVIETTLFAEIAKWFVMGLGVTAIMEGFAYVLAPIFYHFGYEKKQQKKIDKE